MRRQCSHCLGYGHNKRTCPDRGDWAKDRDRQSNARRRCSYCAQPGHNRRKCAVIESDLEVYRLLTGKLRESVVMKMAEANIGIGTILTKETWVKKPTGGYERKTIAFFVGGVEWNNLHFHLKSPSNFFRVRSVGSQGGDDIYISLRGLLKKIKDGAAHPVGSKQLLATLPVGYYKGEDITKKIFAPAKAEKGELQRRQYFAAQHNPAPEVVWARKKLGRKLTMRQEEILAKYLADPTLWGNWSRYFLI